MTEKSPRNRPGDSRGSVGGQTASLQELRRRLATAPAPFIEGALENPELTQDELVLLLRNRRAGPELLSRVARNPDWSRYYEVRKGLVLHPRTPLPVARGLVGHLYWRDLSDVAEDVRLNPAIRRAAEEMLKVRIGEMALGEQISLARKASRGLVAALRGSDEVRVLQALLDNPRLVERDVVDMASRTEGPPGVLARVAAHPSWGERHAVRLALVGNCRTPIPVSLRLLEKLPRQDLKRLARNPDAPTIVRVGASRRLEVKTDA